MVWRAQGEPTDSKLRSGQEVEGWMEVSGTSVVVGPQCQCSKKFSITFEQNAFSEIHESIRENTMLLPKRHLSSAVVEQIVE